jgi:cytoplasmic iron level regulating protein YaaA (DUF328/UPF0246 family)
MASPLILLPPSEGKAPGGSGKPWPNGTDTFAVLDGARRDVIDALGRAMRADAASRRKLLGVGDAAVADAVVANLAVDSAGTRRAIDRYTGVLYDALAYHDLAAPLRRRVDAQVVILSGLWGAVSPRDDIPDYKLKMGATLPGIGRLSSWWRPRLSPLLDQRAARRTVWNLLPNEHAAAWKRAVPVRREISVRFADEVTRNGARTLVTVSHWNKLLKGALVRHVVATQLTDVDGLVEFEHPEGYTYRPELTERDGDRVEATLVAVR